MSDPTNGPTRLAAALEQHGYSQRRLASELGIKQSSVSMWTSGKARPEAHHREALELLFQIPQAVWLTKDEAERLDDLRAKSPKPSTTPPPPPTPAKPARTKRSSHAA